MITFDPDFINKWNGRGIDFDGFYGDQCMDLMHQYIVEVLGYSDGRILAAPTAKDVYLNFNNMFGKEYFTKIDNTPTGVPQKGDIVFWNASPGNTAGHVAIFKDGNVTTFNSFDQNFPTGSKCHVQSHNYNYVLGWLRGTPNTPPPSGITDDEKRALEQVTEVKNRDNYGNMESAARAMNQATQDVKQLRTDLTNANEKIAKARADLS